MYLFPLLMGLFGIVFIVFIFWKSLSDNKKARVKLTELYKNYGVQTTAKVVDIFDHKTTGRSVLCRYKISVSFEYTGKKGTVSCITDVLTNKDECRELGDKIDIIYIPAHCDYLNGYINHKEYLEIIGYRFAYDDPMIMWVKDTSIYTNLEL